MGDISEIRGLVVVITFLGTLFLLLAWIPPELYEAGEYRTVEAPDIFESIDVFRYAETKTIRMNETGGVYLGNIYFIDGTLGERDIDFFYRIANETPLECWVDHEWVEWIIIPMGEHLTWVNRQGIERGTELSVDSMELDREADNASVRYRLVSKKFNFQYFGSFAFNSTLWGNFTDAWNHHGLWFFMAVDFDQVNTSYNAFQLIGMLLFFQLPEINFYINALIAIPIWIAIAYITIILIYRTLGAIFGGGA